MRSIASCCDVRVLELLASSSFQQPQFCATRTDVRVRTYVRVLVQEPTYALFCSSKLLRVEARPPSSPSLPLSHFLISSFSLHVVDVYIVYAALMRLVASRVHVVSNMPELLLKRRRSSRDYGELDRGLYFLWLALSLSLFHLLCSPFL